MFKKAAAGLLCLSLIFFASACSGGGTNKTDGKLSVTVTFNAMKEFAQAVGGDRITVHTIIPDGSEPHDFEPKAKDLARLSDADVFIYNGLGMENWAQESVRAVGNNKLVAVESSAGIEPIAAGTGSEGGGEDPHAWLSLKGAKQECANIRDGFIKADPADKAVFESNYQSFAAKLDSLNSEYAVKFKSVKSKNFVTGHACFAYLCRDYGLRQNSVEDVFADGEPSAKNLRTLIDYCKAKMVKVIFAEELVSPAVSQTLADQVGARVETIHTMESSENDKDYLTRMKENLSEIYSSLSE